MYSTSPLKFLRSYHHLTQLIIVNTGYIVASLLDFVGYRRTNAPNEKEKKKRWAYTRSQRQRHPQDNLHPSAWTPRIYPPPPETKLPSPGIIAGGLCKYDTVCRVPLAPGDKWSSSGPPAMHQVIVYLWPLEGAVICPQSSRGEKYPKRPQRDIQDRFRASIVNIARGDRPQGLLYADNVQTQQN